MGRQARSKVRWSPARSAALLAALVLLLTGCAAVQDPLTQQARSGDNKNYIAGDGSVSEYAPSLRKSPVKFQGTLFDGSRMESSSFAGHVVVLNFWYAACGPCRLEAPTLRGLSSSFQGKGVRFYGVNVRDEANTAAAFERNFGIPYPSFDDRSGGVLLAMTGFVPPQAVPTTLVLDKQGRVAARILGVADKATLGSLISDSLAKA